MSNPSGVNYSLSTLTCNYSQPTKYLRRHVFSHENTDKKKQAASSSYVYLWPILPLWGLECWVCGSG